MNSLQDSRRGEGQDKENPSSKNTENGNDADIRRNDFSSSTERIPSSTPQVIIPIVDDFENPISVTNSVIDPSATAIDTAAVEAKDTGSTDVMAVEPTNCTTEPGTSRSNEEKHVGSEVGATALAAESNFLDVKLKTQKSGDEERLGKVDMVLDPTISHTETAAPKRGREEQLVSEEMSTDSTSEEEHQQNSHNPQTSGTPNKSSDAAKPSSEEEGEEPPPKKQKQLSLLSPNTPATAQGPEPSQGGALSESNTANGNGSSKNGKKSSSKKKTKNSNVWTKPTSRKGKKKSKNNNSQSNPKVSEDTVWITPAPRFPDRNDDSADTKICLSRVYKAEKVELSDDRLTAGSCKGYRMVRATRGVTEGAWFFEIKVVSLGETGHARLGWSTDKGDLQAPVGYDANSFGYRDIDGCKIHKAVRDKYGEEGYKEGDVIGFYISLPEGNLYAPKPPRYVLYKGQRYVCAPDSKEEPPKIIPGSEISFFKNGRGQGVAFEDLQGGRYYPAASMYTLPNQPNCVVKFNFGPDFECFPDDFGGRPAPKPMIDVPYQGFDSQVENGDSSEKNQ